MNLQKRALGRLLASLPLLALANVNAQTPAAAPAAPVSGTLQIISFGGGFNLPIWAARDQGFFKKHGIEVQHTITADSKQVFSGLMEGKYHVAVTALDNILAYQEGQGELKFDPPSDFFGFMGSDDGFLSLVAAPDVKTFADLKGKTISVDSMSNGFSFALRDMLARNGIKESEVQWARAGGTDRRFAALMEGQHAATMLRAPFDLQAKNRGFNQLATTRSTIGNYMGIVGAARRSWAANNEAQVVGFIRAYRDAIRWLKLPENRPQAQALLMKYVPNMNAQIAAQSCDLLLDQQSGFFSDVQLDDKGIQAVLDLRSNLGDNAKKLTDASKYIDKRYWQKAMQP